MPKEKSTRTTKRKADGGRKKKGMSSNLLIVLSTILKLISLPDPNQPKRGLSAYMFFANEQRDKVREDNPGIKFGMSPSAASDITSNQLTESQARSANFSARSGRPSARRTRSRTMPRPRPTSSVTRRRRQPTLP